jgi:hypothetical protein
VVLFDEVEKAHPDVFNTLLQILEDGRLTDAQGRSVDFKNTVLIMTSNLGTADLRKSSVGFAKTSEAVTYERMKAKVNDALKAHFRPEFLNRIDEVIVFHELSREEVIEIVDLMLEAPPSSSSPGAGHQAHPRCPGPAGRASGYDPQFGARPLRRAIQQLIEDPLVGADPLEGVPGRRDHRHRRGRHADRGPGVAKAQLPRGRGVPGSSDGARREFGRLTSADGHGSRVPPDRPLERALHGRPTRHHTQALRIAAAQKPAMAQSA